mmetsp:Transcript_5171/g.18535  ORF Transcript_5171/g.18535 Transcript_5171/m.18535 type:complete len:200 (-) Transcript_5171:399-998(-)
MASIPHSRSAFAFVSMNTIACPETPPGLGRAMPTSSEPPPAAPASSSRPNAYASTASTTTPTTSSSRAAIAKCSTVPPTHDPPYPAIVTSAWSLGSRPRKKRASFGGDVALRHAVRASPPGGRITASTSDSNPPSKSRSASSNTCTNSDVGSITPRSTSSLTRPGVPITTLAPALIAAICGASGAPPTQSAHRSPAAAT